MVSQFDTAKLNWMISSRDVSELQHVMEVVMPKKSKTPKLVTASVGVQKRNVHLKKISTDIILSGKRDCNTQNRRYDLFWVLRPNGKSRPLTLMGQTARALKCLIASEGKGITALDVSSWALRLAAYIHTLRTEHGLEIKTLKEPHLIDGLKGYHARYVLLTKVRHG